MKIKEVVRRMKKSELFVREGLKQGLFDFGYAIKFGNTPDHCFIFNDSVVGVKTPPNLDRQWYIDLAKKRLKQFGVAI